MKQIGNKKEKRTRRTREINIQFHASKVVASDNWDVSSSSTWFLPENNQRQESYLQTEISNK